VVNSITNMWAGLKGLGAGACPIVIILCWLLCSVSGPAFIVEVSAGALFEQMYTMNPGVYIGMACCSLGMWLGCNTAFFLGRRYFKPMLEDILKKHEMLVTVNEIITEEGWKFAFLIRMNPLIPLELFNYAVALTDISAYHNAISAWGSMFIVCFEVYGAASATAIASAAAAAHSGEGESATAKIKEILIKLSISAVLMVVVAFYGKSKYDAKVKEKQDKAKESLSRTPSAASSFSLTSSIGKHRTASALPAKLLQHSATWQK